MPAQNKLFGPYGDQHLRVSDAERQAIADRLAAHYGDGRLDQAEFDDRATRAMTAKTRGDLRGLLDDLPEPGPAGASGTGTPAPWRPRHRHPIFLTALLVFIGLIAAHELFWLAVPGLFLGFLGAVFVAVLAVTGHLGQNRK